jgi:hypothetical protein
MIPPQTELLYNAGIDLEPAQMIGSGPHGTQLAFIVRGGTFAGPKMRGSVLPGGGDWLCVGPDGAGEQDAHLTLRTDEGELIYVAYGGVLAPPPGALERLGRGERIEADEMYFRCTPRFRTGAERLKWLNRSVAIGIGALAPNRVEYSVHRVC